MIKFTIGYCVTDKKQPNCDDWTNGHLRGIKVDKNICIEKLTSKIKKMMNKKEVFGGKKLEEDSETFKKTKVRLMYCSKILEKEVGEEGTLLEFWKKNKDPNIEKKMENDGVYELEEGMTMIAKIKRNFDEKVSAITDNSTKK
jgi:hypothetical protein